MTDNKELDERALEALFEAERAAPPAVPDVLMQRVLADAAMVQPSAAPPGWRGWLRLVGGAPGLGGLVTAGCVGLWLGLAPPAALPDLAGLVLGLESTEAYDGQTGGLTGFGWDLEES